MPSLSGTPPKFERGAALTAKSFWCHSECWRRQLCCRQEARQRINSSGVPTAYAASQIASSGSSDRATGRADTAEESSTSEVLTASRHAAIATVGHASGSSDANASSESSRPSNEQ